jgi:hypothetical protein
MVNSAFGAIHHAFIKGARPELISVLLADLNFGLPCLVRAAGENVGAY